MATDENLEADGQSVNDVSENKTDIESKIMFAIMMLGAMPIIFIQTAIRTALPTMLDDLAISPAIGQWIVTGYTLTKGIMVPISAFFMIKFRSKQLFLSVLALFSFGSLTAALGGTFPAVFFGSILQGISGGIIFPLIQTILFASFPLSERGRAFGMMSLFMGIGPLLGPSLGGWMVDAWSWQYMYLLLAILSFLGMVIGYFKIDVALPISNPSVDWLSIVFSVFGFGGVLYGLSVIGSQGFNYYPGWMGILAGLVFIALLNIPISTAGLNTLEEDEMGHGTAVRQTIRGLGSTFSTALVFSALSLFSSMFSQGNAGSNMAGVRASFLLTFIFAGTMFILTLFFEEKE